MYPSLKQSWELFGIFLLINLIVSLIVLILNELFVISDYVSGWITLAAYLAGFLPIIFYTKYMSLSQKFDYCKLTGKPPVWLLITLVVFVPAMTISVDSIVSLVPMPETLEQLFAKMISPNLSSFLTVVIAAPILEELLCRGIILKGLLTHIAPYKAIVWSSLIFAAMHLNPWQGIAAFIIGFISGWLFWKTKSIIPSIFIHFLNNGFAFILLLILDDPTLTLPEILGNKYIVVLCLASFIFLAGLFLIFKQFEQRRNLEVKN
ncbi:MAG: CPBP family intramembrane metalloprotease [Prevotellaceae bacterium]|jgi:membrane protease YdiL (CAAX protease family)|nr:CPBP family intramembrane metalloprotease [Prevotellaceae bacterium]